MRQTEEDEYWQLFDPQAHPCFAFAQDPVLVVLSTPQQKMPSAVMPGTEVGGASRPSAPAAEFSAAVKARYGACIITGTRLTERHSWPWVEACHIDTRE